MTDEMIELGRRAVACRLWKWMPGMVAFAPESGIEARVQKVDGGILEVWFPDDAYGVRVTWLANRVIPDFSDPATLGCLQHNLRGIYNKPSLVAQWRGKGKWWVGEHESSHGFTVLGMGDGEAAAMVKTLEKTR